MISKFADVSDSAKLGKGVVIEGFTTIYEDVEIGEGTHIGPNVTIYPGARIGKHCKIYPGAVIAAVPQDLKFAGEYTTVEIGDHTTIRECVTIHRGTNDLKKTVVGSHCLLMGYVHIAHDCVVGNHCIMANYSGLSGHNVLEDYVILEGKVGTQQFIRIGAHAFVAGGSLIRKNIPPFVRAAREPLSYVGVNSIGLRRRGVSDATIKAIEDTYRILYVKHRNMTKALEDIDEELASHPEVQSIVDFVNASDKGIMKGPL